MKKEDIYSILSSTSIVDFKKLVINFFSSRGYIGAYRAKIATPATIFSNYPKGFWRSYFNQELEKISPIERKLCMVGSFLLDISDPNIKGKWSELLYDYGFRYGYYFCDNGSCISIENPQTVTSTEEVLRLQPFFQDYLSLFQWKFSHLTQPLIQSERLSPREIECLKWMKNGKTIIEASDILCISERTVRFHLQNIYNKMGVYNKTAAVAKAITEKII